MICNKCGTKNIDAADTCIGCGAALGTAPASAPVVTFVGRDLADGISFTLPKDGCVIGRVSEFMIEKLYDNEAWSRDISRMHCEISLKGSDCQITHIGRTNPTYWKHGMGYSELPRDKAYTIHDGDVVAFGNEEIAFTVHFKYPDHNGQATVKHETKRVFKGWAIVCPVCGCKYPDIDINNWEPIQLCDSCTSMINKRKIRYAEPQPDFEDVKEP